MIYRFSIEIREILIELLKNNIVVTSWGFTNLNVSETDISFEVDAYKYKGIVSIATSKIQRYYEIRIGQKIFKECHLKEVVEIIDKEVEYSNKYQDVLKKL